MGIRAAGLFVLGRWSAPFELFDQPSDATRQEGQYRQRGAADHDRVEDTGEDLDDRGAVHALMVTTPGHISDGGSPGSDPEIPEASQGRPSADADHPAVT